MSSRSAKRASSSATALCAQPRKDEAVLQVLIAHRHGRSPVPLGGVAAGKYGAGRVPALVPRVTSIRPVEQCGVERAPCVVHSPGAHGVNLLFGESGGPGCIDMVGPRAFLLTDPSHAKPEEFAL